VLLHEMAHASCDYLNEPLRVAHGDRFKREIIRLYINGEPSLAAEPAVMRQINRGLLPCGAAAKAAILRWARRRTEANPRRRSRKSVPKKRGKVVRQRLCQTADS
jgi:hypothetical protein